MKNILIVTLSTLFFVVLVSCGSYKKTSSETDLQQKVTETINQKNDKIVEEILKTTIDFYGDENATGVQGWQPQQANPKKARFVQTKTTTTTDKGTLDKKLVTNTDLKTKDKNKEKPWQPPWYLSGLFLLVLAVVYKVFKSKFQIIKRI